MPTKKDGEWEFFTSSLTHLNIGSDKMHKEDLIEKLSWIKNIVDDPILVAEEIDTVIAELNQEGID